MKRPHRAMALRGLLYCTAILIKKFLVGNAEIRSGAEKSMVRSDCRVVFFHRFRSGERYLSAALESPHDLPCGTIAVNLDDSDGVLRVRNSFTHLFPKPLSGIHGVHRDRAADPTPAQRTDLPLRDCRNSSFCARTRRTSDRPPGQASD